MEQRITDARSRHEFYSSKARTARKARMVKETTKASKIAFLSHTHIFKRPRTSAFERCGCVTIGYRRSKIDFFHGMF